MPDIPVAYLITFRRYGTWLHGDERGSIDRHRNRYREPYIAQNGRWRSYNSQSLKHEPVALTPQHRKCVERAIRETCLFRNWDLHAVNVRTNHAHSVIIAYVAP